MTFSQIVPEEAYKLESPDEVSVKIMVKERLRDFHKGKKNAVNIVELTRKLNIKDKSQSRTKVRALIKELIGEGNLIASCSKGFYWIQNRFELVEYLQNLEARIKGIETRRENLIKNWKFQNGQDCSIY